MAQGAKSFIFNNNYKFSFVKCLWFWFWLIFVSYATWSVFFSMDEITNSGYQLGLLLAIMDCKATAWKNSNFYWNFIIFYSTQNGRCGFVCVPCATWLPVSYHDAWRRMLSWDSCPIAYVPPKWCIKEKNFGSRQVCCMSNY